MFLIKLDCSVRTEFAQPESRSSRLVSHLSLSLLPRADIPSNETLGHGRRMNAFVSLESGAFLHICSLFPLSFSCLCPSASRSQREHHFPRGGLFVLSDLEALLLNPHRASQTDRSLAASACLSVTITLSDSFFFFNIWLLN